MTLQAVAGFLGQSGILHPANLYRNLVAGIHGRRSGFFRPGDFALTPSGSSMNITIGRGDAMLMGTESSTTQGGYYVWNNASETLAWPAAAAQPRIDSLILRVIDTDYGSDPAGSKAVWEIVSGTAAASPVRVSDSAFASAGAYYHPGAWYRVADVTVPAGITNLAAASITFGLNYTRQGRAQLVSSYGQEPGDPQKGDLVQYNGGTHGGFVFNWNGTAWVPAGSQDWQTWTPIVRNNAISGTPATISSTLDHARYKRMGDMVFYQFATTVNASVTNGNSISLPVASTTLRSHAAGSLWGFGPSAPSGQMGIAYHGGVAGNWDRLHIVGSNTLLLDLASGTVIRGSGFYYVDK